MKMTDIKIRALGQVGYRYQFGALVVYIDPYLSNSVQEKEDSRMQRLLPVPVLPQSIDDADCVFITHAHRDHCDEDTLLAVSQSSLSAKFIGPLPVCTKLGKIDFAENRVVPARDKPVTVNSELVIYPVPSSHPVIEPIDNGGWAAIGYIFEYKGYRLYHAGDTSLCDEIIETVTSRGHVDMAFLPVNEKNYYKDKQNVIGNMSVREAFYLAEAIGAGTLVPTHWDMFEINRVFPEEIELLYRLLKPGFKLEIMYCK
jgi:L-ascorbate metabolism protein UlaG (beta-lactamase superfamily)